MENTTPFVTLHTLSQQLGLPAAWIKAQAQAGKMPSLRIGRRLMFNLQDVQDALVERTKTSTPDAGKGGDL